MKRHGYSTSLRSQYVSAGWLVQPAQSTYKRPIGLLDWQRAVVSLQKLMSYNLAIGGRTALDLQGFSHYLSASGPNVVHLYGKEPPPSWLAKLPLQESIRFHKSHVLFKSLADEHGLQGGTLRKATPLETKVCRRSWIRTSRRSASFRIRRQGFWTCPQLIPHPVLI